ncbi:hypothetical protein BH10PSE14_BH10PSE14_17620 [soil metagenome]
MTIDDYIYAAILSHIGWQQVPTGTPYKRALLQRRLLDAVGVTVPSESIERALSRMAEQGLIEVIETGVGEPYLKLNYKPINEYIVARTADTKSAEYVYRRLGKQILSELIGDPQEDNPPPQPNAPDEPPPTLTEAHRTELVSEIDRVIVKLDSENISNEIKSQAYAYLSAAKTLAEAPEPPTSIIWDLIERASHLAGITALFVSIIALFGH